MLLLLAREEDVDDSDPELSEALRKLRTHVAEDLAREYVSLIEAAAERRGVDE